MSMAIKRYVISALACIFGLYLLYRERSIEISPKKCILREPDLSAHSGLGDYVRLSHRGMLAAKLLGCAYMNQPQSSSHGYQSDSFFSSPMRHVSMEHQVFCDSRDLINITQLNAETRTCTVPVVADSNCTVIDHHGDYDLYQVMKAGCVADEIRGAWNGKSRFEALDKCKRHTAIHYRWGDIAGPPGGYDRLTKPEEVDIISREAQTMGITDDCVFVFAESYNKEKINDTSEPHIVVSDLSIDSVINAMATADLLFVRGSGMTLVPVALNWGKVVCGGNSCREYKTIIRSSTTLCHLSDLNQCDEGKEKIDDSVRPFNHP